MIRKHNEDSKRILCLIDSLASGGAERQMSYLVRGLAKRGNFVKLCIFSRDEGFYESDISDQNIEIEHNLAGINRYKRIWEIVRKVKQFKPDSVIAYKDGVTIAACLARCITRFHLIVSERNTTQAKSFMERLKFGVYRFASCIVPNSYSQLQFIKENYPHLLRKTIVITNMIDAGCFYPVFVAREKVMKVVTVARVMRQKNVLNYIRAVKMVHDIMPDVRFEWYGNRTGDFKYLDEIQQLVNECGLLGVISFYDARKDLVNVYRTADIFCLPSTYEGFPNVLCEAMACGIPSIASAVCDNPAILEDGVNGYLCNPDDPADIADKLVNMIKLDASRRSEISVENNLKISRLCGEHTFIDRYEALFLREAQRK